ncbi:MAG: single-stranded-DNA-specific exonuclease RecJ [Ruminococcaceae bacterium]|nr:single-stranded-DNA-specific exonuclease RecJ [Oscillospiraceae bacterium]
MFDKIWKLKPYMNETDAIDRWQKELAESSGLPFFVAETLVKRGIYTSSQVDKYFSSSGEDLWDPFLFEGMDAAVQRILDAADVDEYVTVYGDYDADGITATAILWHFLMNKLNVLNADYHIPDRFSDGYGLSCQAIDKLAEKGTTLIITVDCGIVGHNEIEYAKTKGIDVIVTDHHRNGDTLPDAIAVIDPICPGCSYPFKYLCGAGVAFKLVQALAETVGLEDEIKEYLPIVAIATIGDAVSLTGENRVITSLGLKMMPDCNWVGLKKLMEVSGTGSPVSVRDVSFGLVPRLNAAGRIDSGEKALQLLLADNIHEAERLAEELSEDNKKRQELESCIYEQSILPESIKTQDQDSVVISVGKNWHHGVVGIVASRLVDRFNKPALVFAFEEDGETIRGSARSVPGFNIHEALSSCSDYLEKFGGHAMAAGMSLKIQNLPELIKGINDYAALRDIPPYRVSQVEADCVIELKELNLEGAEIVEQLQPCGEGNPEPLYIAKGLDFISCSKVGTNGTHLRLQFSVKDGTTGGYGRPVSGIAFGAGAMEQYVSTLTKCDVLFKMSVNVWNDKRSLSLQVLDIREADVYNTPYSRKDLVVLYNIINKGYSSGFASEQLVEMKEILCQNDNEYTWFKIFKGIEIFTQLGILNKDNKGNYTYIPPEGKLNLETSGIYQAINGLAQGELQ